MDISTASTWIQGFLSSVPSYVFVPALMIIMGLIVKMKPSEAISSGLLLGVAFTGMSMLISYMTGIMGPIGEAMLGRLGINLPIVDGGWTTMSAISWTWPYAVLMFPLMIVVNIIMLTINQTDTFNADLWNVWGKIFTAVGVVAVTGSVPIAFVVAAIQIIFELKIADVFKDQIYEMSGIPGVTTTHRMVFTAAWLYPIDKLLRKIPALNTKMDAAALHDKIGIFAENHVLGFILGCFFGLLAGYDPGKLLGTGIECAMCLTLFPVISKYFMEALSPISEAVSDYMNARFEGRQLVVGLDWPFLGGANEIWIAAMWGIPVTTIWAFLLAGHGNEILPFAGIVNVSLAVPAWMVTRGNVPRMCILFVIAVPVYLFVGTAFAPFMTDLANSTGLKLGLSAGQMISNSGMDAPLQTYAFAEFLDCLKGNFLPLICLVIWILGFIYTVHDIKKGGNAAPESSSEE